MSDPRTTYYELRDQVIDAGGITAGARDLAQCGDYAGAVKWLKQTKIGNARPAVDRD